jgi:S1-C subfamily serine protease
MLRFVIAILLSPASSFTLPSLHRTSLHTPKYDIAHTSNARPVQLHASIVEKDGLFWPSSSDSRNTNHNENGDENHNDEESLLGLVLDSVLKVYATHSEPDFLMPWQKRHQTTSTSSGFVVNVPGIGIRVMTNAHSVEYGSVVQVQRRGEDKKHEGVIEAVGNECDLALLRVDSLFPPSSNDAEDVFALQLGALPSLQDEVEVLGYPSGGESLCVTKGVVSRIETQEYAQAGARLLAMQIDAAINPG